MTMILNAIINCYGISMRLYFSPKSTKVIINVNEAWQSPNTTDIVWRYQKGYQNTKRRTDNTMTNRKKFAHLVIKILQIK
jgi:hypothetical protein